MSSSTLSVIFVKRREKKFFIKLGGKSIEEAPHYFSYKSSSYVLFQAVISSFNFLALSSSPK